MNIGDIKIDGNKMNNKEIRNEAIKIMFEIVWKYFKIIFSALFIAMYAMLCAYVMFLLSSNGTSNFPMSIMWSFVLSTFMLFCYLIMKWYKITKNIVLSRDRSLNGD